MRISEFISSNKRKTYLILIVFIFLCTGFFFIIGKTVNDQGIYLFMGLLISIISGIGSYLYSDRIVLSLSKAVLAREEVFPEYFEITRNLVLSSGQPMPLLYIIADEAMNAFATGRNPKNSVVVVTTGLLQKLNKEELQGVIAHELSHIQNYDILLMSVVSIVIGTVVLIADLLNRSLLFGSWGRGSDNDRSGNNVFMNFLFIITLLIMPIIATLIQLVISRKREFLADASSARLCRNPHGLINALQKISADVHILKSASNATAHMCIVNPFYKGKFVKRISSLFSTHPPVEERIKILNEL
jgi:heat shock protein HtpX